MLLLLVLLAWSSDNVATRIITKVVKVEIVAEEHLLLGWFHLMRHLYAQLHGIDLSDIVLGVAAAQRVAAATDAVLLLLLVLAQAALRDHNVLVDGIEIVF